MVVESSSKTVVFTTEEMGGRVKRIKKSFQVKKHTHTRGSAAAAAVTKRPARLAVRAARDQVWLQLLQ